MDKMETITKYELMLILDAHMSTDNKEQVLKGVAELINKSGGKVINSQVWSEKQKFTFEIKKHKEGTYYLVNFEGEGNTVAKIESALKLNEKVLRSVVVKAEPRTTSDSN